MIGVEDDFVFFNPFLGFLLVHTLDTPLQTQTHTQACGGGGGGGGGGRGGGGSGGGRGGGDGGGALPSPHPTSPVSNQESHSK